MGNLLLGGFGLLVVVLVIVYFFWNKEIQEEYEGGWKGWWIDWLDGEERAVFIGLAAFVFLVGWGVCSLITHAMVKETYTKQTEATVYSFNGTGDNTFTIGRSGCYYYVMISDNNGQLSKKELYAEYTDIVASTIDEYSSSGTLLIETKWKKIKRTEMPFMFFSKKDKVKKVGACACGSPEKYILRAPSKFTFVDVNNN
jgi:hypothetical protein